MLLTLITKKIPRLTIYLLFIPDSKGFSHTAIKRGDSEMMAKIKEMTDRSKAFKKSAEDMSSSIGEKNKFNALKDKEWNKLTEFVKKNFHLLNEKDQAKAIELFDEGQRMDNLISNKLVNLDLSKIEDCKKAVNLSEMSIKSKYTIFDKLNAIFKSSVDKKVTDGTISKPEVDVFNILLGKRNQEKEDFLKFKENYFKNIKDKFNNNTNNTKNINKPSSSMVENIDSSSSVDHTTFADQIPSQEIIDVVQSIFDSFS